MRATEWDDASAKISLLQFRKNGQAIIARIDLIVDDDAAAIACAEQLIVGEEIRVWEARLVARLPSAADVRSVVSAA